MALVAVPSVLAGNWPQWRGPHFDGSADETGLPVSFSPSNHVAWVAPMPGPANSTPVIWNDHVWVTSTDDAKNLHLLCLDRRDGKIRWQRQAGAGDRVVGMNNMASPSPVTDGKRVAALFGTGVLVTYDLEGKELWRRDLGAEFGRFAHMWLYGASPLLWEGRLYIPVLQRNPPTYAHAADDKPARESFLLCMDFATGRDLWRQLRPTQAVEETMESYTTPYPARFGTRTEILLLGADHLTSHDPKTGAEFWRTASYNAEKITSWRVVPTPLATADGLAVICLPKRAPVLAFRPPPAGTNTPPTQAWACKESTADCVTPLLYRGKLYVFDGDKQNMTCLEPATGRVLWQGNVGVREIFRSSPTGADGRIYCVGEKGTVVVLEAGDAFKILATNPMGGTPVRGSIAAAAGQLFLRTASKLFCLDARK